MAALLRIGWAVERQASGSHRVLVREGWPDYVFAFHDAEEIGPRMLACGPAQPDVVFVPSHISPLSCSDASESKSTSLATTASAAPTSPSAR